MQTIDRWRKWSPSTVNICGSAEITPSKPTKIIFEGFEGTILGSSQIILPLTDTPAERRESFMRWMALTCVDNDRFFTSLSILFKSFSAWQIEHDVSTPTMAEFEMLLVERNFLIGDVAKVRLVSGLAFHDDIKAFNRFQWEVLK
jgi:hypothetical protein